jgi:hypothetical protein
MVKQKELPGARWLGSFGEWGLPQGMSAFVLLKQAVEEGDRAAVLGLLRQYEEIFDYCTHEVPLFVLIDSDSATNVDDCEELLNDLRQYEELGGRSPRVGYWRRHFTHYGEYLKQRHAFKDYKDYLVQNGIPTGRDWPGAPRQKST